MKKFAIYLPQFHRIPENDEWWGEGFTEWEKVRNAKPLYKNHVQPIVPLNENYYDLSDVSVMKWQYELAEKYGIDGFAYYHYYFKGKLLLEKPAENMLADQTLDRKFFFIWANHTWSRSWEGEKTELIRQEYGDEADWANHFDYLLKFFKDPRYEKKDNKPLFCVFSSAFREKYEMFSFFEEKCKENGFDGLYLIEAFDNVSGGFDFPKNFLTCVKDLSKDTKAVYIRQPLTMEWTLYSGMQKRIFRKVRNILSRRKGKHIVKYVMKLDANKMVDNYCRLQFPKTEVDLIQSAFFSWDNTPRHGYRGYIIKPVDQKHFFKYMDRIKDSEYVLFNAWNEWAEGMVLEPTEQNGYKYLEWIKEWTDMNG